MPFELSARVVRLRQAMSAEIDREIVILSLTRNHYVGLDEVGRRIWELLETPQRASDLCETLAGEFDASPEQIAGDLLPFLLELESEGLVQAAGA